MSAVIKAKPKTLQEIADETSGPERCDAADICKHLRMALNFGESNRVLVCKLVVNMKSGVQHFKVAYFGRDLKKGIVINHCPFCGNPVPVLDK